MTGWLLHPQGPASIPEPQAGHVVLSTILKGRISPWQRFWGEV